MRFFPDSNFFFQFKDAREIDWSLVTEASDIELYVARTVHQEIDRHKGGGNVRRAEKARKASSLLRKVLESPGKSLVYREAKPRVTLKLAPRLNPNREKFDALDLTQPDDRLIEEVLSHQSANLGVRVALLTDDGPAMATALDMGLEYVAIPGEWRLPPEPSAEAKELAELRRRVTTLEKTNPVLGLSVANYGGVPSKRLDVEITKYVALSALEIADLLAELERLHPEQRDFAEPQTVRNRREAINSYEGIFGRTAWRPPSETSISRYSQKYHDWRAEIEAALGSYHRYLNASAAQEDLIVELNNTGSLPANNLAIDFGCEGGILLDRMRKYKGKPNGGLTMPPKAPKGAYVPTRGTQSSVWEIAQAFPDPDHLFGRNGPLIPPYDHLLRREPDDPYAFAYYTKHRDPSDIWELRCQQFRHQLDPKRFAWRLFLEDGLSEAKGVIRVRVSASNVSVPGTLNIPLHLRVRGVSPFQEVLQAIDPRMLAIMTIGDKSDADA